MKLNYYRETDSLYIDLSSKPSVDSREVSEGIVAHPPPIDIDSSTGSLAWGYPRYALSGLTI